MFEYRNERTTRCKNQVRRPTPYATVVGSALVLMMGVGCDDPQRTESSAVQVSAASIFENVTDRSGLASYFHKTGATGAFWFPESMGPGIGIIDYNSDDRPDILVAGGGEWDGSDWRAIWLFRNEGNLRFTDVTEEVGLLGAASYSMGVVVADYDADGFEDFLLTSIDGVRLYKNVSGQFRNVTEAAGLSVDKGWSTAASFFDADGDGFVDLLVGHYVKWTPEDDLWCSNDGTDKTYCTPSIYQGQPLSFYRNKKGHFTDATATSGFAVGNGKTLGIVAGDVYGDWRPDVYIANDTEADQLFVNDGAFNFREIGLQAGISFDERGRSRAGMGVDFGELNDSGAPTLVVGNFAEQMIGIYQQVSDAVFIDRSAALKIGLPSLMTLTFGLALVDVDLDGRLDLVAANGHIQPEIGRIRDNVTYAQPPHVFIAKDDGTFQDIVPGDASLSRPMVARGLAYADFDRDGDAEIVFVENSGGLRLWNNTSVEGGRVGMVIELHDKSTTGEPLDSPVLDARIELFAGGSRIARFVKSAGSYLSSSEPAGHFAIGQASVDSIRIRWPDGTMQVETDVAIAPFVRIRKK